VLYFVLPRGILSSNLFSRYVTLYLSVATSEQLKQRKSDNSYV
jgi:hypothetical protein